LQGELTLINGVEQMRAVFFCLACLGAGTLHATELHVGRGQVQLIDQPELHLDRLVLEDGATLRVAPGIEHLRLTANDVSIGNNVRLLGAGKDGVTGASAGAPAEVGSCEDGATGQPGVSGTSGGNGVSLELSLGLRSFGSLLLDTHGGKGGSGGKGGNGGNGGVGDSCAGGVGGNGGAGGNGGTGGNGGDVVVRYWSLSEAGHIPISNYGPGVQILTAGGEGAAGGAGGALGLGGEGEQITRSNGIKATRNSGPDGKPGLDGQDGPYGKTGQFLVQPQAHP
jgi:hypothetical protein